MDVDCGLCFSTVSSFIYLHTKFSYLLGGNNLVGTIPDEIGALAYLTSLNLKSNHLSGKVPASLRKLKSLVELDLSENQLSSTFPNLLEADTLQTIQISHNLFSGSLPFVGRDVVNFNVSNNNFEGLVPLFRPGCTSFAEENLELLDLSYNAFSGQFSFNYDGLTYRNLKILKMDGNSFHGYLASSCGFQDIRLGDCDSSRGFWRKMPSLTVLSASKNQFTGPVSMYMGEMEHLQEINLSENALSGPIPSTIGKLRNLKILQLHDNNLTGTIPESFAALSSLGT